MRPTTLLLLFLALAACGRGDSPASSGPSEALPDFESVPATSSPENGCPEGMVAIPSGSYPIGDSDPPRSHEYRLPSESANLPGFCIDRFEYPGKLGVLPRREVTWFEAKDLCQKAGKRLCSEREWVAACRGPEGWVHAYGPVREEGRCNAGGHDSELEPSGSRAGCQSVLGVFDLNGNLSEWVADPWAGPPLPQLPPDSTPEEARGHRVVRGGTMWEAVYGQDCRSRHSHSPGEGNSDDGFRCCRDG